MCNKKLLFLKERLRIRYLYGPNEKVSTASLIIEYNEIISELPLSVLAIKARREFKFRYRSGGKLVYIHTLCERENGCQKGGNTRISAKPATKLEYTRHVVNMFKHDNNHNVSIIPEDEAPYRPLPGSRGGIYHAL